MNHILKFAGKRRLTLLIAGLVACLPMIAYGTAGEVEPLEQSDRHAKISRLVTTLFERSHYRQIRVDDDV